jgi:uncharacterized protein DUF4239
MPYWFSALLDGLAPWQQFLLISALFIGITWLGILLVHPLLRRVLHGKGPSNEVIMHVASNFGVFYAVLLGLLTIMTFEANKKLTDNIGRETASLSALYHTADGYPNPLRSDLQAMLRDYTRYVIDKDWPAHRKGMVPMGGEHRLDALRQKVLAFEPATKTQELLQKEMLSHLNSMTMSRELRLQNVSEAIPGVLWLTVVLGALLTIAFVWMLHMEWKSQLLLSAAAAFFLGLMIFLIYAMDHPLRGAVALSPEAFESVYDLVMKWDESQ